MKLNRTYLFVAFTSVALLIVLVIQVVWLFKAAEIKEEIFNEKANRVLSRTAEALSADTTTYKNLKISVSTSDKDKIDSLIGYYMNLYNFHIDYTFDVKQIDNYVNTPKLLTPPSFLNVGANKQTLASFQTCLEDPGIEPTGESNKNKVELTLIIPAKEKFIRDEMGSIFITSVTLILVVLVLSWRTILSLLKERRIAEHTTDFLNNMTHEFKTPLTNIALAGKMMVKDVNIHKEDKIKHYTGIVLDENEKLRKQVEQVLSMTALERGEIPLHKEELDFHLLIQDAIKYIGIQLENKQGSIQLDLLAEHFVVIGDKTHLSNALCNLIDNAIKYAKEIPEITIQTSNIEHQLLVVVSDKGIGIDKVHQKKIFDKFFRVPTGNVHDVKGFGLGLAYVKKICELHRATIELQSEKGKGTIFTIAVPYV